MLFQASSAFIFNAHPVLHRACAVSDSQSNQQELDPVTLHNSALMNVDTNAQNSFRKLNYLLQNPPCPAPTFGNLLLLYCKYTYYDLAADVLAENAQLTLTTLKKDLYEYLDATIEAQTSPEEA